jgi:hypothetical protein
MAGRKLKTARQDAKEQRPQSRKLKLFFLALFAPLRLSEKKAC